MRSPDDLDRELAVVAMVRRITGGSMELTDLLLDERLECQESPESK